MFCSICKKREATVHVTLIDGDKLQKQDFCQDCADASSMVKLLKALEQKRISGEDFATAVKTNEARPTFE